MQIIDIQTEENIDKDSHLNSALNSYIKTIRCKYNKEESLRSIYFYLNSQFYIIKQSDWPFDLVPNDLNLSAARFLEDRIEQKNIFFVNKIDEEFWKKLHSIKKSHKKEESFSLFFKDYFLREIYTNYIRINFKVYGLSNKLFMFNFDKFFKIKLVYNTSHISIKKISKLDDLNKKILKKIEPRSVIGNYFYLI